MKTASVEPLEKFEYDLSGRYVRIRWNEEIIYVPNQFNTGTIPLYQYDEAFIESWSSRNAIIEDIIASVYTTGAELATINNKDINPDAYAEYQAFRQTAKDLTDEFIATR
jgi:hypothetical protein